MDIENMINAFEVTRDNALAVAAALTGPVTDPQKRYEMACYIEELKDMFDYKIESLKMRAALV